MVVSESANDLIKGKPLLAQWRRRLPFETGSRNVIKRNRVSRGREGIRIEKGHENLVADNIVSHARRAGIRLGILHPFIGGGADNVVRGNLVKSSRVNNSLVNAKDNRSLLKHNTARGAGDDGFDIQSRTATLTGNPRVVITTSASRPSVA